jgi:branched-chain amino acid transport system substrate-binding protein
MAQRITRRTLLKGGAALAAVAGTRALDRLSPVVYAQGDRPPIRIGFLPALTGTAAPSGRDMLDGLTLYLDQHNTTIGGRPVQLIVEDTGGNPTNTLTKTRKLVEGDRVHILIGPLLANEGYAIRDYVIERKVPTILSVVSADDLTQRKGSPYLIRTSWSSSLPSHPFGEYAYATLKYRKIAMLGNDYAFPYEVNGGFQRTFEAHGGQIVQKLWAPLGTPDFSPYVTQFRRDVDAIYATTAGADAIRFAHAYRQYGLKDRIPLIGGGTLMDESLLRGMAPEDAVGVVTALHWSAGLRTPEARKFVSAYVAKYQKDPSYYAEACYTAGRWIDIATTHSGGKVEDRDAFLQALRTLQLPDAPRGPVRLDAYQNPIENVYVRKVERAGTVTGPSSETFAAQSGGLVNSVIYTFHNVSQFWTFKPEEYLKQPVYDRNYPPCKFCG